MENQKENPVSKEVGSNLTGTAVPGKPGHQRDIPPQAYQSTEDKPEKHTENTDALLGDVHPTERNNKSQEEHNAEKEK